MNKSSIYLLTLTTLSVNCQLSSANFLEDVSPYMGMSIGWGQGNAKLKRTYDPLYVSQDKTNLSLEGIHGRVSAGGDVTTSNKLVYGIQVNLGIDNMQGKATINPADFINQKVKFSHKNSINVAARIGVEYDNFTPFIKFGATNALFHIKSEDAFGVSKSFKKSFRKTGQLVGVGVNLKISKKWVVGFEYEQNFFQRFKTTHTDTAKYSIKPRFGVALISLNYVFGSKSK